MGSIHESWTRESNTTHTNLPQSRAQLPNTTVEWERPHYTYKNDVRIRPWNLRNDVTNRELLGPVNRRVFDRQCGQDSRRIPRDPPHGGEGYGAIKRRKKKVGETKVMLRRQCCVVINIIVSVSPRALSKRVPLSFRWSMTEQALAQKTTSVGWLVGWLTANVLLPAVLRWFCSIFCYYLRNIRGISHENKLHLSRPSHEKKIIRSK